MKLLLGEMLTPRLASLLIGHEVSHVAELGWRRITNGKLLVLAERNGFKDLITKDNKIPYQQSLTGRPCYQWARCIASIAYDATGHRL